MEVLTAKILIKKKITLDFLGEEYKDDYLIFKSMPLREYEALLPEVDKIQNDGKASLAMIKKVLENNFIEGKFQGEDVAKEDLVEFDLPTLTHCFEFFTGQVAPKD